MRFLLSAVGFFVVLLSVPSLWATTPFTPVETRSHVEVLREDHASYQIGVGGTVDMDNTLTRKFDNVDIAFQNNESLVIANTGDTTVRNPRVVANDRGRWWSLETLLSEILAGAENNQEKALLIYEFVKNNRYHDYPIFVGDEMHDPVRFLNEFGGGFCDDSAFVGCSLFKHAGLAEPDLNQNPKVRTLKGHMMCEAYVDGRFQFLDIDQQTYYLDLENKRPVSGDEVVQDHYLAKREQAFGPFFDSWNVGENTAAFFGRDDSAMYRAISGHRMDFQLRPGESVEYRWDSSGRFPTDESQAQVRRRFTGNSKWVYEPRIAGGRMQEDSVAQGRDAMVVEMTTPYAFCGGRIAMVFSGQSSADSFSVAVSLDSLQWAPVWRGSGAGDLICDVGIDDELDYKSSPARNTYFVKIEAEIKHVKSIRIETDLIISPLSLPRLRVGKNRIDFSVESAGEHEITIEHRWRESQAVAPPEGPQRPLAPVDGQAVRSTTVPFQWAAIPNVDLYHLMVSRYPDMRLPYRPSFDVYVETAAHESPYAGLFSPDETYFWRVRARNEYGVWGNWSPVWTFSWQGPRVPIVLKPEIDGEQISILWQPNPEGAKPVRYEIYGSDEQGFTPSKRRQMIHTLGWQPPNYLGATADTSMLVVASGGAQSNMNRAFYRVISIDQNGVESGPSDLIQLPHPFIYSVPDTTARIGDPYHYQLQTLVSIGDLQKRYAKPLFDYWEKEGYEFHLEDAPDWLSVDADTGLLTGIPAFVDAGLDTVTVACIRTYPFEQTPDGFRASFFNKDHEKFKAEWRQSYEVVVE
ncbi:MAG: hypothetical protein QNL91_18555 [Candidatus Krumholzibacteria bacterium]|nr:hypothetical protein [Candidatus Krumholzibacteria bacterium]